MSDSNLRGKWSMPGVPHVGWTCAGVEDLGDVFSTCEMCEHQRIRYAHRMSHPDYPDELVVGCDCAGTMEGDVEGAKLRDRDMQNRAARLRKFLHVGWEDHGDGLLWHSSAGVEVTITPHPSLGWRARIFHTKLHEKIISNQTYKSLHDLKIATFRVVERMKARRKEILRNQAAMEQRWWGG